MPEQPTEPIGRFDHIGIAVHSIDKARGFFEDVLGAKHRRTAVHQSAAISASPCSTCTTSASNSWSPSTRKASWPSSWRSAEKVSITLRCRRPISKQKVDVMEKAGVRVVDKSLDDPASIDAFISPKSAHGLLIQLGQTPGPLNNKPYWEQDP